MSADLVNGTFEALAAIFILDHCRALYRDKISRGVSLRSCVFFTAWGLWNLVYYPSLDQWFSFLGGVGVVLANTLWVSMQIVYLRRVGTAGIANIQPVELRRTGKGRTGVMPGAMQVPGGQSQQRGGVGPCLHDSNGERP